MSDIIFNGPYGSLTLTSLNRTKDDFTTILKNIISGKSKLPFLEITLTIEGGTETYIIPKSCLDNSIITFFEYSEVEKTNTANNQPTGKLVNISDFKKQQ